MKNITITILSILLLITGGYLLYDKVLMEEDNQNINNNENNEQEINKTYVEGNDYEKLVKELQEKVKFTYEYYDWGNAYCGERGDGYIEGDENNPNGYYLSKQYKSYQEMINHLKTYMTEEVITSRFAKEDYVEKDGKLYCADFGKGGNLYQPEHFNIQINKISENNVKAQVVVELNYMDYYDYDNYNVEFTRLNDNWIISLYEKLTNRLR